MDDRLVKLTQRRKPYPIESKVAGFREPQIRLEPHPDHLRPVYLLASQIVGIYEEGYILPNDKPGVEPELQLGAGLLLYGGGTLSVAESPEVVMQKAWRHAMVEEEK